MNSRELALLYEKAHDLMRNVDGLHPQEAFDELLKYLFFKINNENRGPEIVEKKSLFPNGSFKDNDQGLANQINRSFSSYLEKGDSIYVQIWHDRKFRLSSSTLAAVHGLLKDIEFSHLDVDIKSTALRTFLVPEMRRGLGIYLTPEDVVKAMVEYINPEPGKTVLDPACGSGTFLIEVIRHWRRNIEDGRLSVWGVDKNPRMLLLSELNIGYENNCTFNRTLDDFLFPGNTKKLNWLKPNHFDYIFTNPPFGVILESNHFDFADHATCVASDSTIRRRQQSEIVFLEQCLKYLKPGGKLAIVLPKSVITNTVFEKERRDISSLGYVNGVVILPSETFQIAGTQTNTVMLFMTKYLTGEEASKRARIFAANITNVGYDTTGRAKEGNQLPSLPTDLDKSMKTGKSSGKSKILRSVKNAQSLVILRDLIMDMDQVPGQDEKDTVKLGDLCLFVGTGATAARNRYTAEGLFILKVGNLTGEGVDWQPRDRNFVEPNEKERRQKSRRALFLQENDIVLTSSAHTPKYIAQKIDIITDIPKEVGGESTYVGEVMLLRPNPLMVEPYVLYAYLSLQKTKQTFQRMIRGQTAHLNPEEVKNLSVPKEILVPSKEVRELVEVIKENTGLAIQKNVLNFKKNRLLEKIGNQRLASSE